MFNNSYNINYSFGDDVPRFYKPFERAQENSLREQLRALCERDFEVYVDTCSLLHDGGLGLLEAVEDIFPRFGKRLNIFSSVLAEVEKVGSKNPDKRRSSYMILQKLKRLESKGTVKVLNSGNKNFSDVNFISKFIEMASEKSVHHLLLITQDAALAEKINNLSGYLGKVVKNKSLCEARRIGKSGKLERFSNKKNSMEENYYDEQHIHFGNLYKFR